MGTLCKNCPFKNIHQKTSEVCTTAFVQKYKNSCVSLDITEQAFLADLEKYTKERKKKEVKKENKRTSKNTQKKNNKTNIKHEKNTITD
jgi:hypothetical protein